ncbi:hypothetical protein VCHA37P192_110119 [Vibrio chagasii]|nr:hypothetical protein VCHA37P192_110119 [Vibrio chagasii]
MPAPNKGLSKNVIDALFHKFSRIPIEVNAFELELYFV